MSRRASHEDGLVLMQLMGMPCVVPVENHRKVHLLGLMDTLSAMAFPNMASAFGTF